MEYLQEVMKQGAMEPDKFILKFQAANHLVRYIPGAPVKKSGFTDAQLLHVYLKAIPKS